MSRRRRAVLLVEALVAGSLLVSLLGAGFALVRSGARNAARAGEMDIASGLGARLLDGLVAEGYPALAAAAGVRTMPLDLSALGSGEAGALSIDGCRYTATARIETVHEGLVVVRVLLRWDATNVRGETARVLSLSRFVASSTWTIEEAP